LKKKTQKLITAPRKTQKNVLERGGQFIDSSAIEGEEENPRGGKGGEAHGDAEKFDVESFSTLERSFFEKIP